MVLIDDNIHNQMRANFDGLLKYINRAHTKELLEWLEQNNFYQLPASARHHNAFRGGLLKHSLEVCSEGLTIYQDKTKESPEIAQVLSKERVAVCCLLHDICKTSKDNGHGLRSVQILEDIGYPLSEQEKMAIWWHMGKYEPSYEVYIRKFEESQNDILCNVIRNADHNAAKMKERFEDLIRSLNLDNGDRLLDYLNDSSFYVAHSGSHHHYPNGLVAHSLGVYHHIMEICSPTEKKDAAVVSLLHDISMQNRSRSRYGGHGYRSMMILKERLGMNLSDNVLNIIRFHKNSHRHRRADEQRQLDETRKLVLFDELVKSDHYDADHDLTDLLKHYKSSGQA